MTSEIVNPFHQAASPTASNITAGVKQVESKEIALIQASMIMAKKEPRNESQVFINIMEACKRSTLADQATYIFPKGGKMITGPSIRLAEVLAKKYGNMRISIEILSQDENSTHAKAIAFDMETNYVVEQGFIVQHIRNTKERSYKITDERDIREMVLNMGSRNLRTCILRVIDGDIIEAALEQCKKTQESSDIPLKDRIRQLVSAFDEIGVKVEHLEKRLGHNLDATIASEIVVLRGVYKSIKDGMADRDDFFKITKKEENVEAVDTVKNFIAEKKQKQKGEIIPPRQDEVINQETGEVNVEK
jgi:hypothetical protein